TGARRLDATNVCPQGCAAPLHRAVASRRRLRAGTAVGPSSGGVGHQGCLSALRKSGAVRPAQQLQLSVHPFDHGRAGLHPVARIAVNGAVDLAQVGAMNVPTNHAVVPLAAGVAGGDLLETVDVANTGGDVELDPF